MQFFVTFQCNLVLFYSDTKMHKKYWFNILYHGWRVINFLQNLCISIFSLFPNIGKWLGWNKTWCYDRLRNSSFPRDRESFIIAIYDKILPTGEQCLKSDAYNFHFSGYFVCLFSQFVICVLIPLKLDASLSGTNFIFYVYWSGKRVEERKTKSRESPEICERMLWNTTKQSLCYLFQNISGYVSIRCRI